MVSSGISQQSGQAQVMLGQQCKEVRYFERISGDFGNAFQHLEDAVANIERSFAPAIGPSVPTPPFGTSDQTDGKPKSEYQASAETMIARIHSIAERINEICARSGI